MKRCAVALLAKAPVAGSVKTRFCPPFNPDEAADFARAFLLDSVAVAGGARFENDVDVWCSYLGAQDILQSILPANVKYLEQRGTRLDDRISNAVIDLNEIGYANVIVVAADCPTIDEAYFEATLIALETNDVVLGPAEDGGCVLVAVGADSPDMFLDITMSTDTVCAEMMQRAEAGGAAVKVLPVLHDIDTVDELYAAQRDGQLDHAQATQALLARISSAH